MPDSLTSSEHTRLIALESLGVLDTPAEQRVDRFTRLAAMTFGVPIALVSLVDQNRQWFKSRCGLDVAETPRSMAFCSHAVELGDMLVIEDAAADPRFAANPLVTGAPHIRFYAGQPLFSDGQAVGTLCIIDRAPDGRAGAEGPERRAGRADRRAHGGTGAQAGRTVAGLRRRRCGRMHRRMECPTRAACGATSRPVKPPS